MQLLVSHRVQLPNIPLWKKIMQHCSVHDFFNGQIIASAEMIQEEDFYPLMYRVLAGLGFGNSGLYYVASEIMAHKRLNFNDYVAIPSARIPRDLVASLGVYYQEYIKQERGDRYQIDDTYNWKTSNREVHQLLATGSELYRGWRTATYIILNKKVYTSYMEDVSTQRSGTITCKTCKCTRNAYQSCLVCGRSYKKVAKAVKEL